MIAFLYQNVLKRILFLLDPEFVHDSFLSIGNFLGKFSLTRKLTARIFKYENSLLEQKIFGIKFENPVGLSAGFDKDAKLIDILPSVGFGFEEVGTITNLAYKGNPKPRLVRLKKSKALLVYFGLKNIGVDRIIKKIKNRKVKSVLNISFSRTNAAETCGTREGVEDIVECFEKIVKSGIGDFYTLNISCPNTYGGEPFTTKDKLDELLSELQKIKHNKPLFIKMPIDLPWSKFEELLEVIVRHKVEGVTIGNLAKDRKSKLILDELTDDMKGGISGVPTRQLSTDLIKKTYAKYHDKLKIIGVGGIFSAADAYEKIRSGASLVELITGMVYNGPQLIGQINRDLASFIQRDGYKSISEAVGVDVSKL